MLEGGGLQINLIFRGRGGSKNLNSSPRGGEMFWNSVPGPKAKKRANLEYMCLYFAQIKSVGVLQSLKKDLGVQH